MRVCWDGDVNALIEWGIVKKILKTVQRNIHIVFCLILMGKVIQTTNYHIYKRLIETEKGIKQRQKKLVYDVHKNNNEHLFRICHFVNHLVFGFVWVHLVLWVVSRGVNFLFLNSISLRFLFTFLISWNTENENNKLSHSCRSVALMSSQSFENVDECTHKDKHKDRRATW